MNVLTVLTNNQSKLIDNQVQEQEGLQKNIWINKIYTGDKTKLNVYVLCKLNTDTNKYQKILKRIDEQL